MINFLNDCWFLFTTVLYWSSVAFVTVVAAFFAYAIIAIALGTTAELYVMLKKLNKKEGDEDDN